MLLPVLRKALISLAVVLAACHGRAPAPIRVVFAADQLGYLAPCGCSEHQLGGAARAAAFLETAAKEGPALFVQGGNLLSGTLAPPAAEAAQAREKALAMGRSYALAAKDAPRVFATGPFDHALGADVLARALAGEPLLTAPALVAAGGLEIGLLPLGEGKTGTAASLRKQGAAVVIAVVQAKTLGAAEELAAASGADLALQSGVSDPVADTDEAALLSGAVPAFRVKDKGRSLLDLRLYVPPGWKGGGLSVPEPAQARLARAADLDKVIASDRARLPGAPGPLRQLLQRKIDDLTRRRDALHEPAPPPGDGARAEFSFVELTDSLPQDPAVEAIFDAYNAKVAEANLAAQKQKVCAKPKEGELAYSGAKSCRDCHADAFAVWQGTRHPRAYETLVRKGRQYDVECIGCHVLGYEKPGGVCRLDQVGDLGGVQCEMCHGMGSIHEESLGERPMPVPKPDIETCRRCHTPDNDTRFSAQTFPTHYLPAILGPGHGKPAKRK